MAILKAFLIALSLAIDVFAVSIGLGIRETDSRLRLRFALAFVIAELSMTLIGNGLGRLISGLVGGLAGYLGFLALIVVGSVVVLQTQKTEKDHLDLSSGFGLMLSAVAVSFDSLGIGFSIPFIDVPFGATIAAIAFCTVLATILGFALGRRLGQHFEERAEIAAGLLLIVTGMLLGVLKATGHG